MSSGVEHILLTRFNLPSPGAERERVIRAQEGWLRDRVVLFERFCLPSVRAQSDQRFRWIVYIDPESPPWFMDWVTAAAASGRFHAIPRAEVSRAELLADICQISDGPPATLITTNLDNDDGLSTDFVTRVQSAPTRTARTAIFLTRGLIKGPGGLYLRTDRRNAFPSVREPWDGAVTCWSEWHNRLHLCMPTAEVGGSPGWLQVVHGANVSNRVRGRRVSPSRYSSSFPGLLDEVAEPSAINLVADRLVLGPRRVLREVVRGGIKRVAITLIGRDGMDRLRGSWPSVRART